jgi:hypothetical protein
MGPGSEIHAGAFECESACDSCTNPPSRACHEYTFVFKALHPILPYPRTTAMLRDGLFSIIQLITLNSR